MKKGKSNKKNGGNLGLWLGVGLMIGGAVALMKSGGATVGTKSPELALLTMSEGATNEKK